MAEVWGVAGIPASIRQDGWWLWDNAPGGPDRQQDAGQGAQGRAWRSRAAALAALVALADVLFYRQAIGLSLAVFALAIHAAASLTVPRPRAGASALVVLAVLPVVEHVQALSLAFLLSGLLAALMWPHRAGAEKLIRAVLGLLRALPSRGLRDAVALGATVNHQTWAAGLMPRLWRDWAFPLGGALVLVSLLARANPVLGDWLATLTDMPLDPVEAALRMAFWLGTALMVWPLLVADTIRPVDLRLPRWPGVTGLVGLTANAVTHALIGFNAILAVQTVLDLRYLWSGFAAPTGMTLAEYAHRGAYPLLATALLAGAFALAARPHLAERRMLKPLLLAWVAQNVLLALSAVYRLDLYVDDFGLTYLRVYAGIWMLLVAGGLGLVLWQVAADRPNRWLLVRCAALGLGTLYLCSFVNFAALIARHNVAHDRPGGFDAAYLCGLGPNAAAAIPPDLHAWCTSHLGYAPVPPRIEGWRDWGYREWRVLRYLERESQPEVPLDDPRPEDPRSEDPRHKDGREDPRRG